MRDRPKGRPQRALSPEQEREIDALVTAGPSGVRVRWRRVDLQREIKTRFGIAVCERTVGNLLRRLGFRHTSVRAVHPKSDLEAQEAFKKFAASLAAILPAQAAGKSLEVWFQDEARVGQKGTLTRIWAKCGTRPRMRRDQRHASAYIFGAVCPSRDAGVALVFPQANIEAMNLHLAEIAKKIAPQAHGVVILDRAGWHRAGGALLVPENITLLYLPPYSPELNGQENIWQYLRQNFLASLIFDAYEEIVDACCNAWNALINEKGRIASIAARDWIACKES